MTFKYLGKTYEWTEDGKKKLFQGSFTCECKECADYVSGLVQKGLLKEKKQAGD